MCRLCGVCGRLGGLTASTGRRMRSLGARLLGGRLGFAALENGLRLGMLLPAYLALGYGIWGSALETPGPMSYIYIYTVYKPFPRQKRAANIKQELLLQ